MPEEEAGQQSLQFNILQSITLFLGLMIFYYAIPFFIIGYYKGFATAWNLTIFSYFDIFGLFGLLFITILQLSEQRRAGTWLDWIDSNVQDPNKGLIYQISGRELSPEVKSFLNSAVLMIIFSVFFTLVYSGLYIASGTSAIDYSISGSATGIEGLAGTYLAGVSGAVPETLFLQLLLMAILYKIARKAANGNIGLLILFTTIAFLIGTGLDVLVHHGIYGTNEKALIGVFALFGLTNFIMILTGSGIFPLIFHPLNVMAQDLKIRYAGNEYAVVTFIVILTIMWSLFGASYLIIWLKARKRHHAEG